MIWSEALRQQKLAENRKWCHSNTAKNEKYALLWPVFETSHYKTSNPINEIIARYIFNMTFAQKLQQTCIIYFVSYANCQLANLNQEINSTQKYAKPYINLEYSTKTDQEIKCRENSNPMRSVLCRFWWEGRHSLKKNQSYAWTRCGGIINECWKCVCAVFFIAS